MLQQTLTMRHGFTVLVVYLWNSRLRGRAVYSFDGLEYASVLGFDSR